MELSLTDRRSLLHDSTGGQQAKRAARASTIYPASPPRADATRDEAFLSIKFAPEPHPTGHVCVSQRSDEINGPSGNWSRFPQGVMVCGPPRPRHHLRACRPGTVQALRLVSMTSK